MEEDTINYHLYKIDGIPFEIRGPKPDLAPKKYFVCLGSGQTLGVFCEDPFPNKLSKELGIPVLNLSKKDGDLSDFLECPKCIDLLNNSLFVVVQIMGAKAEKNKWFDRNKEHLGSPAKIRKGWKKIINELSKEEIGLLLKETKDAWIKDYKELASEIKVPKILFYFSKKRLSPFENFSAESIKDIYRGFPRMVDKDMVFSVKDCFNGYAKTIVPEDLIKQPVKEDKDPLNQNKAEGFNDIYYLSQQAHNLAVDNLKPICKKIMSNGSGDNNTEIDENDDIFAKPKYIIFAHARSGSSTLSRVLEQNEDLKISHEPFQKGFFVEGFSREKIREVVTKNDLIVSLKELYKNKNGFKHIQQHIDMDLNKAMLSIKNSKIVFLYRRNVLKTVISSMISSAIDDWGLRPRRFKEKFQKHSFEPISVKVVKATIEKIKRQREEYKSFLIENKIPFFDLAYEDIFGLDISYEQKMNIINKIFDFWDKKHVEDPEKLERMKKLLDPQEMKTNSEETYEKIPNIYEIEELLGSEEDGYLFEEKIKKQPKIKQSFFQKMIVMIKKNSKNNEEVK